MGGVSVLLCFFFVFCLVVSREMLCNQSYSLVFDRTLFLLVFGYRLDFHQVRLGETRRRICYKMSLNPCGLRAP